MTFYDKQGRPTLPCDDFGYVNYLQSFHDHGETLSRATGRTTRTLNQLKEGDILIVDDSKIQAFYKRELLRLKKKKGIDIVVIDPRSFRAPRFLCGAEGNLVFEHVWMFLHIQWRLTHLLEFPKELFRMVKPKGGKHSKCPTSTYSGQIWPEDTGKVQH